MLTIDGLSELDEVIAKLRVARDGYSGAQSAGLKEMVVQWVAKPKMGSGPTTQRIEIMVATGEEGPHFGSEGSRFRGGGYHRQ